MLRLRTSNLDKYALTCSSHTFLHTFTQMHIALIPILRTELGLDTLSIGLLASIPLAIQGILTVPGGLLADRMNQQRLIAISLLISAVGGILMAQVNSILLLILLVSLFSVSSTLLHPPALSIVGDLAPPNIRGKILGIFGSAGTFGIALGPIALSFFIGNIGWRLVYLMWSIPVIILPILLIRQQTPKTIKKENKPSQKRISSDLRIFRNSALILLFGVMGARSMGGNIINTYITPYFVDVWRIEPATASLIFGLNPLLGIFAAPLGGIVVDRIGEKKWIAVGLIADIAMLSLAALSPSLILMIMCYLLYSFFATTEMPAEQSYIAKLTPTGGRGLAFSLSFLPSTLTGAFSPILAAFIVDALGIWYIFPIAAALITAAASLLIPLRSS